MTVILLTAWFASPWLTARAANFVSGQGQDLIRGIIGKRNLAAAVAVERCL
ncbi:hypothetical protein ABIF90_004782 [Bradyrhizobium japonicum]